MLKLLSTEDAARLVGFFAEAQYTDEQLRRRPMLRELPQRRSGNEPWLLDATREPSAQNTLLRLFLLGRRVESEVACRVIPQPVLAVLVECGMVRPEGNLLIPNVMLAPRERFLFAADPLWRFEANASADIVLWPNQTTGLLQNFMVRNPSRSTLDLGSGCGILAVLAASHSERVIATDLNPRAAEFTRFNARLNSSDNVECSTGDTFEPVKGQRFDLILANPPFFITPTSDLLYCENPMELDQYCRRIVREVPLHLNEGGYFQMLFEWVQLRGERWTDRLEQWLDGTGCDAWVVGANQHDPASYAHERTRDLYAAAPEAATEKFSQLVDYYRARKVEMICGGFLAMRRRSGHNWIRMEETPVATAQPFGTSVLELFKSQTLLSEHPSDNEMQPLKPRLPDGARLNQQLRHSTNGWELASVDLAVGGALPASMRMQPDVAQFVGRCNGERTLDELVRELSAKVNAPPEQVRQQCCELVRRLAARRLLSFA
jgi:methylase of polypeptide subunit release factors